MNKQKFFEILEPIEKAHLLYRNVLNSGDTNEAIKECRRSFDRGEIDQYAMCDKINRLRRSAELSKNQLIDAMKELGFALGNDLPRGEGYQKLARNLIEGDYAAIDYKIGFLRGDLVDESLYEREPQPH